MAEKQWRPPDWERHYPTPDKLPIFDKNSLCDCTIFEAGADAMLGAVIGYLMPVFDNDELQIRLLEIYKTGLPNK